MTSLSWQLSSRACVVSDGSAAMLWTVEGGVYGVCDLNCSKSYLIANVSSTFEITLKFHAFLECILCTSEHQNERNQTVVNVKWPPPPIGTNRTMVQDLNERRPPAAPFR